ncbi:MAG: DUF87 domain-containing protein [Ignavibacteriae bacterium]|nr:DUF87 domain-containing protein [Ignavibacteriota bacterium]
MIFNYQYLPKTKEYESIKNNDSKNYALPINSNYLINNSKEKNYFSTLETTNKNYKSGTDIADMITNDKLNFLGTTVNHLKSQIEQRSKIRDDQVKDLDKMIRECDVGVMNLESWPMFTNQLVEKKRADFKTSIQKLELEKQKEMLNCWKDQNMLYKELLETLGEYKNVQRRSKMLSGGFLELLVEDICVKLRPILGEKIDSLWRAYLVEDMDGKREIEQILNMLYLDNLNTEISSDNADNLLAPPPAENVRGEYPIGEIMYAGKKLYPFCLRENDWIKHVLIVGASGSGKTNLCFQVLKNFIHKNKPFLVLDWKRNYRDIVTESFGKDIRVYTVGRDVAPFMFNPLIPPPGTSPKTWLKS